MLKIVFHFSVGRFISKSQESPIKLNTKNKLAAPPLCFVWNRSYTDFLINFGLSVSLLVLNSIIDVEESVSFLGRTFYF